MTHSFIHSRAAYHSHPYVTVVSDFSALRSDEASCAEAGWIGAAFRIVQGAVLVLIFPLLRSFRFEFSELCRTSTGVFRQVLASSITVLRMENQLKFLCNTTALRNVWGLVCNMFPSALVSCDSVYYRTLHCASIFLKLGGS
jgi:hypothetical protein